MAGVNKAIIVGNLGRDPEIRYSQQGTAVVKLAIATSESWTDKNTGQRQEKTEWHRVTVFGKMAENCERFLSKGRQVYVEGRLQTSSYEKEGQTHYTTEIIANAVQFLGGGGAGAGGGGGYQGGQGGQGGGGYQPQGGGGGYQGGGGGGYKPPQQQPAQSGGAPAGGGYQGGAGSSPADPGMTGGQPPEDDIPF